MRKRKKLARILIALYLIIFSIYTSIDSSLTLGMKVSIIFAVIALGVPLSYFIEEAGEKSLIKKAIKKAYKKGNDKGFIGEFVCSFNEDFFQVNDLKIPWSEFGKIDTDDLYVFMYLDGFKKVAMFPKFPDDLPLEERDKLNQIIQNKFNVNIRL